MNRVVDADTGRGFQLARIGATWDVCAPSGRPAQGMYEICGLAGGLVLALWRPCALLLSASRPVAAAEEAKPDSKPSTALPIAELKRDTPVDFEKELLPILKNNCLACHNTTKAKGG